ncbi:MAG: helix-turn-helix domain-containing protein [Candidatus Omnitrophica bacterium]|nr:helix-turn-helix domain-containing protein [Candidatus Omnitrophota bacterium]
MEETHTTKINQDVLTVKETARYLRISEMTVLRLVNKGLLPAIKLGRQWRISTPVILRMIRDHMLQGIDNL